ncbi:MAG: amidohydrolase [Vicinamibacterales bacterium]|nr:amidohydrolase [Vicinamibacterales bacterium]
MLARRTFAGGAVAWCVLSLSAASAQPSNPIEVDLLLTGGTVITMDRAARVITNGAVAVDGADIVAVGSAAEVASAITALEIVDTSGRIVLPGFVNTHTHAPMVMFRGLADDVALKEWLEQYIFPAEAKTVTPEFVRVASALAVLEMIRSGTTTFVDMYYFEEVIAEVVAEAGLRAVLGQTVIQFPAPDAARPADALARADAFIQAWAGHERITPAVAPHAMHTLDEATLVLVRDLAMRHDVPILIHLAETEDELRIAQERYGRTPTSYLESIGFWGPSVLAAHGVWLSEVDIDILRRRGVGVSHNPESNMKLASGSAPVPEYLAAGVDVGLGTDGAASNNDLDMFEAMRFASLLHKLQRRDPKAVSAQASLQMATIGGARAIGLESEIGSIELGKRADLIVVSMAAARQTPMYDPISHLVYATRGDDVIMTIVHGRILMRDGRVLSLDEPAVLAAARRLAAEVSEAVR